MPALKTPHLPRESLVAILHRAAALSPGEELFVPANTRPEQTTLVRNLTSELKVLSEIDPSASAGISILPTFRDKRFWVRLTKFHDPLQSIFIKDSDGTISKQTVTELSEITRRHRRISLMLQDGFSPTEILAHEPDTTPEEIAEIEKSQKLTFS